MREARISIIFDLMYIVALCVLYGLNTPSNRSRAEILQVEEIGSAKQIINSYMPCIFIQFLGLAIFHFKPKMVTI